MPLLHKGQELEVGMKQPANIVSYYFFFTTFLPFPRPLPDSPNDQQQATAPAEPRSITLLYSYTMTLIISLLYCNLW